MFVMILTLSASFLSTIRALAAELPDVYIDTHRVQELELRPEVTEAEARHLAENYSASGHYDRVEIIRR